MLFPTLRFALFFFIVFFLYWYVFRLKRQRVILLIVASYFFYACWDWRFCILLFGVTVLAAVFGALLGRQKNYVPRTLTLITGTVLHIVLLGFFKYFYDITVFLTYVLFDVQLNTPFLGTLQEYSLLLPVGISYYTFRSLSYIFDIYLCKMRPVKSFADLMLYISFFPQLASGPIVKAEAFFAALPESLERDSAENGSPVPYEQRAPIEFDRSILLIICGIYKKMILAHFLLILAADPVFANPAQCNTIELIIGLLSYTFVIYCDFSGYSDMAVGIALLLGFHTPHNFNRPYISQSVSEFWRRWHISFSSWLRDYVYFAFGGSRFGLFRTVLALIGTMLIAGLWHGGSLTFLLWGFLQGSACAVERIVTVVKKHRKPTVMPFFRLAGVFLFINISWLVFRAASVREVMQYVYSLKNIGLPFRTVHSFAFVPLTAAFLLQLPDEAFRRKSFDMYIRLPVPVKAAAVVCFFIGLNVISTSGIAPFIYFGF
ncbi:MAG: MBOAT family protein [Treponema sp.]